jgi:hypothetical protein
LTGISPGAANETTTVNIGAVHNNPAVLTNLAVNYTPGASTGSLSVSVLSNATGSATITVTASDGGPATLRTFQIIVRSPTNLVPVISGLTNIATSEDTSTGPIPFTVSDPDSSPNLLTVTAVSFNTNVVPSSGLSLGGSGANRTITINPLTNQSGSAVITLTVSDPAFGLSTTNFIVQVNPVNDLPTISGITNQAVSEDTPGDAIPIVVRDTETFPNLLVLSASSSNPELVPDGNLSFGGSGSNRVLVVKAVNGQLGLAVITVTVTDLDGGAVSTNFNVTVISMNDSPVVSDWYRREASRLTEQPAIAPSPLNRQRAGSAPLRLP